MQNRVHETTSFDQHIGALNGKTVWRIMYHWEVMAPNKVYEGTLEEITAQYGLELRGRHLRVLVDDDSNAGERDNSPSESAAEWIKAFTEWISAHDSTGESLSDEAISRDSIYEGRG